MVKSDYKKLVDEVSPNSPIVKNCIRAFFIGGLICVLGQFLHNILGAEYTVIILIGIGALLTALNLYSPLGKFAGAGSIVPITGFANSVASAAVEFKSEGVILGLGSKIFLVAGPVIVYGLATSSIIGLVYYLRGVLL